MGEVIVVESVLKCFALIKCHALLCSYNSFSVPHCALWFYFCCGGFDVFLSLKQVQS